MPESQNGPPSRSSLSLVGTRRDSHQSCSGFLTAKTPTCAYVSL